MGRDGRLSRRRSIGKDSALRVPVLRNRKAEFSAYFGFWEKRDVRKPLNESKLGMEVAAPSPFVPVVLFGCVVFRLIPDFSVPVPSFVRSGVVSNLVGTHQKMDASTQNS